MQACECNIQQQRLGQFGRSDEPKCPVTWASRRAEHVDHLVTDLPEYVSETAWVQSVFQTQLPHLRPHTIAEQETPTSTNTHPYYPFFHVHFLENITQSIIIQQIYDDHLVGSVFFEFWTTFHLFSSIYLLKPQTHMHVLRTQSCTAAFKTLHAAAPHHH
ncbi:hypothetical protein T07_9140 [Trichinella nelsoni]|uniref:Uncharacterized protein n=1 Tax=Trichinella nelsoni TaxID=6336 RepID=A0A0V0SA51_9BILA|nr:hypothetical protein T07_9140 [Trichinella nelsoni]